MHDLNFELRARAIAIQLINRRDPDNISTLKKLLAFTPDPRYIRKILIDTVLHISETSAETTCWLLQNPDLLLPEVDVTTVIALNLSQILTEYGLVYPQDYDFDQQGALVITATTQNRLRTIANPSVDDVILTVIDFLAQPQC